MKTTTLMTRTVQLAAVFAAAAIITGCASSGYKKGAATGETVERTAAKIELVDAAAKFVVTNITDLTTKPQTNLEPQFKTFTKSVDQLGSHAASMKKAAKAVESKSQVFLADWEKQIALIKNEEIKAKSEARRKEVAERLEVVQSKLAKANESFTPLMSDLSDLKIFLAADLTPDGVASAKPLAAKAVSGVPKLSESLTALTTELKALGAALKPVVESSAEAK